MNRWQRSHGRVGVNAPSWLTFEVHQPYFDGRVSPRTAVQARGVELAARLFDLGEPLAPRFGMVMPASYRRLLSEESRLPEYRMTRPTDLAPELASPTWAALTKAFADRSELDGAAMAGLAQWLVAACLHEAMLELAPVEPKRSADPLRAVVQGARAIAMFQVEGLSAGTRAAFRPLLERPEPIVPHVQAAARWSYLLARHAEDDADAPRYADLARRLLSEAAPDLSPLARELWLARLAMQETMHAERHGEFDRAWDLLESASEICAALEPTTDEEALVVLELWRRIIDRRVEVAVRRGDHDAEEQTIVDGLALDPYCVKIRMQAAQAAERRGDAAGALRGYLLAARLGPFGTAFALMRAASVARGLEHTELAMVLDERAFRAAPRSRQARAVALAPLRPDAPTYESNRLYQMYGAYFNLGPSHSPCLYARLPWMAYEFAVAGEYPRVDLQRAMPPAFRRNLVRESGLVDFSLQHPAQLADVLRTPAWQQLCDWVAGFQESDLQHQFLICKVLSRLGLRKLILELVPERPVSSLRAPLEFSLHHTRDFVRYAASIGGPVVQPRAQQEMVDHPDCPIHLRLSAAVFGVVFAARQTRSLDAALTWRTKADDLLKAVLISDEFTPFEKTMLESRYWRGVSFVPFMRGDRTGVADELDRAETLARAVPADGDWEAFLKRENLHACLESRSKEAYAFGDIALGHRRTEEFLALDPYDPKSHIELGESLLKQQRFAEAADSYLRAARLGPLGTAIAYAMAGECYERAGDPALAEDCFVQALRVDPYAISAARGWRRVGHTNAFGNLATEYADQLEAWGARASSELSS